MPTTAPEEVQDAVQAYYAARVIKEQANDALKLANKELEMATLAAVEIMDRKQVPGLELAGIGRFSRTTRPYASMISGAEKDVFAELKARGYKGAIKQTVHSQTLTSIVKEIREKNGKDIPGVDVYEKEGIMFRRAGGARTKK